MTTTRTDDIAHRLERWTQSGDPRTLWPDLSEADHQSAMHQVAAAIGAVLAGRHAVSISPNPDAASARSLGIAAFLSGTGPLMGYWIESGQLVAGDELSAILARHLEQGRQRATRLQAELRRLLTAVGERGIAIAILKGAHTGEAYFPEPGTRPASDIDLLVSADATAPVFQTLEALGFERDTEDFPFRSTWQPPGTQVVHSLELTDARNPWSVDVHWSLDRSFRGVVSGLGPPRSDQIEPFPHGVFPAGVLKQPLLAAYLAIHASAHFDHPQLIRLVELALIIQRDRASGRLDWGELRELLQRTDTTRFAYPALALTDRLVPGGVVDRGFLTAAERATPERLRRVLAGLTPASLPWTRRRSLASKLVWAAGPRETWRTMVDLLLPGGQRFWTREARTIWLRRLRLLLNGDVSWDIPNPAPVEQLDALQSRREPARLTSLPRP